MSAETATREYRRPMPVGWWTRKRHYFFYIVREFTSLPLAVWLLWFLVEIQRAHDPRTYHAHSSGGFVIFSIICLGFALYHSVTFLSLAGSILHFNVGDRPFPSRLMTLAQFAMWAAASALIGFALIYLGQ